MAELNPVNEAEQGVRPLLEVILEELDDIKNKWREVGEVLKVSKATLDELQKEANFINDKENFKIVMKEWIDKNMNTYMWSPLLQALNNSNIGMDPSHIEQLHETYCQDHHDAAGSAGDNDESDNDHPPLPDDHQDGAANDDDDLHDCNRQGKCQRLIQWCCCPCRTVTPCCKKARAVECFKKTRSCIGTCLSVSVLPIILAIILLQVIKLHDSAKTDELDRLLMEDQAAADRLLKVGVRPIRILVTGKTGTGKSALINGIIGDNVTEEGSSLDPTTTKVEQFKRTVQGVPMFVFDSPGLQDGTENEKEYLLDMERKCKKIDLVLYTMKMTDKRLHPEDKEAMKKLTNAFGPKFWESSMFVMTFANEVRNPEKPDDEDENRISFEKSLSQWMKKLPSTVEKELNVSKKVARSIPVVPAGYYKNIHLPGRRYWFSQFWKSALDRMKEFSDEGYSFMLRFNKDRFKRVYETTQEELAEKYLHEQPIIYNRWNKHPKNVTSSVYSDIQYMIIILVTLIFLTLCMTFFSQL